MAAAIGLRFPWFHAVLAVLAGAAQAASLAWPLAIVPDFFDLIGLRTGQPVWWLQWLSLALLAWLLRGLVRQTGPNWRRAALWGWLFGTAWLGLAFGWTFVALHTFGGLPLPLAALAVFLLAGALALFYAVACGVFVALGPVQPAKAAIIFAALWLLAELARGTWLTGFGWGGSGYAQPDGPLAGFTPWLGVYGLGALSAWFAMTLAQLPHGAPRAGLLRLLPALMVLALPVVYAFSAAGVTQSAGRLSVTLLQGNIPQDEKFDGASGVPLALAWYQTQLQNSRSALVIAPETAIPLLPQQLPPGYWGALERRFASGEQAALIGIPLGTPALGYTNSVLGLKPGQAQPWRYDKQHLVPFGEFIPTFFKWFTELMNIPLGDFNRGALQQPPFAWQGQKLAATICYEDLFGEELARNFVDPAQVPTVFVNLSNLAWFGHDLAMNQHLQIARLRALEFERPWLMATNTGVTALVDHRGRVVSRLASETRAVWAGEVEGRNGITPYAWWVARAGLWPLAWLALAVLLLALRAALRKR